MVVVQAAVQGQALGQLAAPAEAPAPLSDPAPSLASGLLHNTSRMSNDSMASRAHMVLLELASPEEDKTNLRGNLRTYTHVPGKLQLLLQAVGHLKRHKTDK